MSVLIESGMKLADKFFDIILRFFPDREKARQASVELAKLVITAEVSSQWLVGQWRAMAMLALTGGILWRYVAGTLDFLTNSTDTTMGLIWLIGFFGYAITSETTKVLMAVLKPNKKEDGK